MAAYHFHVEQMTKRRLQGLVKASKRGLTLHYDHSGAKNCCFFRCLAKLKTVNLLKDDIAEILE